MKKILFAAVLAVGCAFVAKAQKIGNVKVADIKAEYLELSESRRAFGERIYVCVEYGQKARFFEDMVIRNDNGDPLEFNSGLACVMWLKDYGYDLFQVYAQPIDSNNGKKIYVMKKK